MQLAAAASDQPIWQITQETSEQNMEAADDTMRAVTHTEYGSSDVLRLATIERPTISEKEVLVRTHAAGLDRGTWHLMAGLPYLIRLGFGIRRPKNPVPGLDVAGTVAAAGAKVTRFEVGDEVYGIGKGSFAEYTPALEAKLARKPANATFEQAAAVPVSGLTAIQGLRDAGRVKPGQHVLVVGASGGVGTYVVQLAKALGAEVTGVSRTDKLDLVRSIGADDVIDYTREDFADGTRQYDLILDIGGNTKVSRLRGALTEKGTLVIVGGEEGDRFTGGLDRQLRALVLSPFISQRLTSFIAKDTLADLERLTEMIEAGQLTPTVDSVFPLEDAPEAMRRLEDGEARGKLVISVR